MDEFETMLKEFEDGVLEAAEKTINSNRLSGPQTALVVVSLKMLIQLVLDIHSIAESQKTIARHAAQQTYSR